MKTIPFLTNEPRFNRLICQGTRPEHEFDGDDHDRHYMPARFFPTLRSNRDISLQFEHPETRRFAEFCQQTLGLQEYQFQWVPDDGTYHLDKALARRFPAELRARLASGDWVAVPYSVTPALSEWHGRFAPNMPVFGDHPDWVERWNRKCTLHPAPTENADKPLLIRAAPTVRVPRGYSCSNMEQLDAAFERLQATGVWEMIMKPSLGTTGEGIVVSRHLKTLRAAYANGDYGTVVLEELLGAETDQELLAPSIQFNGRALTGVSDQVLNGMSHAGNRFPTRIDQEVKKTIMMTAQAVVNALDPTGPGGLDFLVSGDTAYLVDPNLGRQTGAHPTLLFRELYMSGCGAYHSWKITPNIDAFTLWERLNMKGIAFKPREGGVFPICLLKGMWGMLAAFGPDEQTVDRYYHEAMQWV